MTIFRKFITLTFPRSIIFTPLLCLLLTASCTLRQEKPVQFTGFAPAWQPSDVIAQAYQTNTPALNRTAEGWLAVWIQGDRLAVRTIALDGTMGPMSTLPPGNQPWQPVLLPNAAGQWHLLWFDLDRYNEPRLYAALLSADGTLLRGPITVASEPVSEAAIAPGDQGTVIIIWADTQAIPTLFGQSLDSQGRPNSGPPVVVIHNAEAPVINRMGDGTWLVGWLAFPDAPGQPSHSRTPTIRTAANAYPWEGAFSTTTLGAIDLPPLTEYIEHTTLGLDRDFGYLFISTRSAETGQAQSRVLVFPLMDDSPTVSTVENLSLPATSPNTQANITTGFNTGPALPANEAPLSTLGWPTPLYGQSDTLPVAFNMSGQLTIGYFAEGEIIGYQPLDTTQPILGAPGLWTDQERYLTAAAATYPNTDNAPADLLLTSTRPELKSMLSP